jgi:enamine deaminase RidA (YjgF/YER057c/UK114 family)
MAAIEFKSIPSLAGGGVSYAHAVKAGPFIFLTGHEAFDFATGSVASVAGPPGFPLFGLPRYRREGDFILQRMRAILQELGSDLSHGVRLDQYYPTTDPVDPYHLARRAAFGDYIPPSTSVVMERCFHRAASISTSLIAVVPSEDYKIARVYPKDVKAPSWSGFVPAITCNDFIFVAGQMATNETDGLHAKARVPDHARWGGSAIRKQTEFLILDKLKPAMEAAGSSLENAVKAQVYIEKIEDFPDFIDVWNQHFAAIPCAVTVVPTKSYGSVGGIIEINLLGLTGDAKRRKQVVELALPEMASYGPCVRVGEFLFPSGLMAIGTDGRIVGAELSDALDGIAHGGAVQAAAIYSYAERLCAAVGTSPANIVRAQYFLADIQQFSGVAAAWRGRYGAQPHPFVAVQVPAPLPALGAAVIADFWIYIPS